MTATALAPVAAPPGAPAAAGVELSTADVQWAKNTPGDVTATAVVSGGPGEEERRVERTRQPAQGPDEVTAAGSRAPLLVNLDDLPHRLWLRIQVTPAGCWEYTGRLNSHGYGRATWRGRAWYVHRLVLTLLSDEPVPDDLAVDHLCRNRCCCNPAHLEVVTHGENTRRSNLVRSLSTHNTRAPRKRSTTCRRGHPWNDENTRWHLRNGSVWERHCRACKRITDDALPKTHATPAAPTEDARCQKDLHPMVPDNRVLKKGRWICRQCKRADGRRSDARRRERGKASSA